MVKPESMLRFAIFVLCSLCLSAQTVSRVSDKTLANPPLEPALDEQLRIIEAARESALRYTNSLPDFLCTQTVSRYTGRESGSMSKLSDTLEIAVAYTAKGEQYRLEKIDGQATAKTLGKAGGYQSRGDFGSTLASIFRPESQATFHWERWSGSDTGRAHVYSFAIPQSHSTYTINWATGLKRFHMTAAFSGFVFVDAESGQVVRIVSQAEGIPADWPVRRNSSTIDYGYVEIGGRQFLVPRHVESYVALKNGQRRNVSEFTRYRRFAGEANISFGPDTP